MNGRPTLTADLRTLPKPKSGARWTDKGTFIVAAIILTLGFYLVFPVALILGLSFNTAPLFFARDAREWGLDNWRIAFSEPRIFQALWKHDLVVPRVAGRPACRSASSSPGCSAERDCRARAR